MLTAIPIDSGSPMRGKRAFITGITGFTGRYLAQELTAAGYSVFGTTHGGAEGAPNLFSVDLCDRKRIAEIVNQIQPDVVAHLAAISFVAHGNTEDIYRTNVIGTRNLLEALAHNTVQPEAVLLTSSANIYGNANVEPIHENVPPSPANDYAVSKLAMEYMARLWMDKLPITIVRPFNYTGVGQSENFLLPKIVSHYRRAAQEIELGNLDVERDFSDVRSVVTAYRRLIELAPAGETFNICSGVPYSLEKIVNLLSDMAGYTIKVRVNPAFVRVNEVKRLVGSNEKLVRTIGNISAIPLVETLRWMVHA